MSSVVSNNNSSFVSVSSIPDERAFANASDDGSLGSCSGGNNSGTFCLETAHETQPDFTTFQPPCKHNHWDNARVKKGIVTLNCRECGVNWKLPHPVPILCPEFHDCSGTCSLLASCPLLHVHRYKSLDRSPSAPGYAGCERDEQLYAAAASVLSKFKWGTRPSSVLSDIYAAAGRRMPGPSVSASSKRSTSSRALPPTVVVPEVMTSPSLLPSPTNCLMESTVSSCGMSAGFEMSNDSLLATPKSLLESPVAATNLVVGGLLPITRRFVPTQREVWSEMPYE